MLVQVRSGFQFSQADLKGNKRIHFEGEIFDLDLLDGETIPHSLEKVSKAPSQIKEASK